MRNFSNIEISEFNQKIGFNSGFISLYLDELLNFFENNYPRIVDYFSGKIKSIDESNFRALENLLVNFNLIDNKIFLNNNILTTYLDWEISEFLQDTGSELLFASKISKFLRSNLTNYNYNGTIEFDYTTSGNETLEDVSRKFGNKENYNDDWIELSLRNDLSELDYNSKGGKSIKISVDFNSNNSTIRGVVDNINGEKILGIDIDKKLQFVNDDLKTLSYKDTSVQSVEILANMYRGDNPEFEDMGRTPIVGGNKNTIAYTTTIRELSSTFSSDDTLSSFSVVNVKDNGSDVSFNFEVTTRAQEILNQEITL